MAIVDHKSSSYIKTKCLIISDTHGMQLPVDIQTHVDVVIHCGDLTQHSKLDEFQAAIDLIGKIRAPLKIVIAGNHDFTLDIPVFKQKISEANRVAPETLDDEIVKREFGAYGAVRKMLEESSIKGIAFVDEGSHQFSLENGALLSIYASPYTPSTASSGEWGFQYSGAHSFEIHTGTDIVVTHGPPHGIMDISTEKTRIGCPQLFAAVAKAQPRIHCFGHAHDGWGAKMVSWRPEISETPSHFTDIDNNKSYVIENMTSMKGSKFESTAEKEEREGRITSYKKRGYYENIRPIDKSTNPGNGETLFINAAVEDNGGLNKLPWVVQIELPPFDFKS